MKLVRQTKFGRLLKRHQRLDLRIAREQHRLRPDDGLLRSLKKERLYVKDAASRLRFNAAETGRKSA
ncbi:MAG: YdcH family protein [Pseudomonadota bacterium]